MSEGDDNKEFGPRKVVAVCPECGADGRALAGMFVAALMITVLSGGNEPLRSAQRTPPVQSPESHPPSVDIDVRWFEATTAHAYLPALWLERLRVRWERR